MLADGERGVEHHRVLVASQTRRRAGATPRADPAAEALLRDEGPSAGEVRCVRVEVLSPSLRGRADKLTTE